MNVCLNFGKGRTLAWDLSHPLTVTDCRLPQGEAVADPAAAAQDALLQPLDFPRLQDAVVMGDHVVIAVEPGVPQTPAVVAGIVRAVRAAGVAASDIAVLAACAPGEFPPEPTAEEGLAANQSESWLLSGLKAEEREGIQAVWHQPAAEGTVSYLAATDDADPVYLHRRLCDADLVIPIGVQRVENALGYLGVAGTIFPTFSDESTRVRLRAADLRQWRKQRNDWRAEAAQAQWLLGVQCAVRVVPGPGDSVGAVLAGQLESVDRAAGKRCRAAWRARLPHEVELVIATIDGDESEQTWDNVARTLTMAERILSSEGAVVLCTELAQPPGPALQAAAATGRRRGKSRSAERPVDALPADVLANFSQSHRLYLWSRLEAEVVEDIGCTAVTSVEEIDRLSRGLATCAIVTGGQYAHVEVRSTDE